HHHRARADPRTVPRLPLTAGTPPLDCPAAAAHRCGRVQSSGQGPAGRRIAIRRLAPRNPPQLRRPRGACRLQGALAMRFTTYGLMVLMGCAAGGEPADLDDEAGEPSFETAHFAGVNGDVCVASPFNCRFRDGSSRVTTAGGGDSWGI